MKVRVVLFLLGCVWLPLSASATTILKDVRMNAAGKLELEFDREIRKSQIKTEFFRDIVQLSIKDVAVYPAKIFSLERKDIQKVFAYQYTPDLVRCRLSVAPDAKSFEGRLQIESNGKMVTLWLDESTAAAAVEVKSPGRKVTQTDLLKEVQAKSVTPPPQNQKLTGSPVLPSPWKALGWLSVLVGAIGIAVLLIGRLKRPKTALHARNEKLKNITAKTSTVKSLFQVFGRVLNLKKFGNDSPLIETLSSHAIGPKQTISVVRVQGEVLVIGVTNESINLITRLKDDPTQASAQKALDVVDALEGDAHPFAEILKKEDALTKDPRRNRLGGSSKAPEPVASKTDFRDRIKKRVEGLRNL